MRVNDEAVKYAYAMIHDSVTSPAIESSHQIQINDWQLHISQDMDVVHVTQQQQEIIMLGYCLDIRDGHKTEHQILESLLEATNITNELDYINGRYILIVKNHDTIHFYTDATAMMPTCYHADFKILASHDVIIKDALAHTHTVTPWLYSMSLDFTRFTSVYKFNPSLVLDLNTYQFTRIYPKTDMHTGDIPDIMNTMAPYIREMNIWLSLQNRKMIMTLTGGLDSRVSLSFVKPLVQNIEFITYMHPNINDISQAARDIYHRDEKITNMLVDNFNLKHTKVALSEHPFTAEDQQYFQKFLQGRHSYNLIHYFKNYRHFHKVLHIKSTVFEVGKAQFPLTLPQHMKSTDDMKKFLTNIPKPLKNRADFDDIIHQFYIRNQQDVAQLKGRHYYDVNYIESRMANWHASTTQEVDPYTIEFVYVNNRRMLDLLQRPPLQARKTRLLFRHLIHAHWPALLFYDFNNDALALDKNLVKLNDFVYRDLMFSGVQNLSFERVEDALEIKPDAPEVGPHKVFMVNIENQSNDVKMLSIHSTYRKKSEYTFIEVMVFNSDEKTPRVYDITDLNDGMDISLNPFSSLTIKINYLRVFDKTSWKDAGRLVLKTKNVGTE